MSRASSFWSVGQPPLGTPGRALQRLEPPRAGLREIRELGDLRLALLARAVELRAHVKDGVALDDHAVPELLDVGHQRPVLPAGEVEILVAAEQVSE